MQTKHPLNGFSCVESDIAVGNSDLHVDRHKMWIEERVWVPDRMKTAKRVLLCNLLTVIKLTTAFTQSQLYYLQTQIAGLFLFERSY